MNTISPELSGKNNPALIQFVEGVTPSKADHILVDRTVARMQDKLDKKRSLGRGGWQARGTTNEALWSELRSHVTKGDPIDIINLAAMIMVRTEIYGGGCVSGQSPNQK